MNNHVSGQHTLSDSFSEIMFRLKIVKVFVDGVLLAAAFYLAFLFRFDLHIPETSFPTVHKVLPIAVLFTLATINFMRLNQGRWRYSSLQDLLNLILAITTGWIALVMFLYFINLFMVPRSVLAMYWMMGILLLGAARFFPRLVLKIRARILPNKRRVLIIGAGSAGEMIIRQMKQDPDLGYFPVALVDDATKKLNTKIHGVKVRGNVSQLKNIVQKHRVEEIIIAAPSARPLQMRRIVQACEATGIEFKTIPGPKEIVNGRVTLNQLREVKVEDLLDREPVEIDFGLIQSYLQKRVVMITGAAGSIGTELSRQILRMNPKKLYCIDRNENGLFYLEYELREEYPDSPFVIRLADILDTGKIRKLLDLYKPDLVFHAAAFKHVPMMEQHPEEAVRNNVMGTLNMMLLSEQYGAEKFILISTDKAVNPTSVMGATKRVAELLLQSYSAKSQIKLVTVRFGNVLGSFGSVIPLFQKQIAKGGPVTITNPGMKRFFMTIPESVKLILEASRMGNGNEIFVLDMGEPIKLINIARRLIKLSGYEPDKDIPIKVVGSRPGEKIEEELWNTGEVPMQTSHRKIMMAMGNHYNHWDVMDQNIRELIDFARNGQTDKIIGKLHDIIPEFSPERAPIVSKRASGTSVYHE